MEDQQIITLFLERNERALSEVKKSYGGYCLSIAKRILGNDRDAEEIVADALLRVWSSIPPNKPDSLKQYLARITRNLAFSLWRQQNAQKRYGEKTVVALAELGECVPAEDRVEDRLNAAQLREDINAFLGALNPRDRDVFIRRYFYLEDAAEISRRYGISQGNVLQILSRTRRKLKDYLIMEGYFV